jgi:hypothetical protein
MLLESIGVFRNMRIGELLSRCRAGALTIAPVSETARIDTTISPLAPVGASKVSRPIASPASVLAQRHGAAWASRHGGGIERLALRGGAPRRGG